jgi:hypothetical protein
VHYGSVRPTTHRVLYVHVATAADTGMRGSPCSVTAATTPLHVACKRHYLMMWAQQPQGIRVVAHTTLAAPHICR